MGNFKEHLTQFTNMPVLELYGMYREAVFRNLPKRQKRELLQETVNRDAKARGMKGAPLVHISDLPEDMGGLEVGGLIEMNRSWVMEKHWNWRVLQTLLHENIHAWQDQVIDGTIQIADDRLLTEYCANQVAESLVFYEGNHKKGCRYLHGYLSGFLYYFQATERDAKLGAQQRTSSILQSVAWKYGTEESFQEYEREVEENGYYATEKKAVAFFENPNFVKDLNQVLVNHYLGTNVPVDIRTEEAVKLEMMATYEELQDIFTAKIVETYGFRYEVAAWNAELILRKVPQMLRYNIEEWCNGKKLSDYYIETYSVPMLLEIWQNEDFLEAIHCMCELAVNRERAERRIWRMYR